MPDIMVTDNGDGADVVLRTPARQIEVLRPELITNGDFSDGTTGWSLTSATGGVKGVISGIDPFILSADNLGLSGLASYPFVEIRIKCNIVASSSTLQTFFTTTTETSFDSAKSITKAITIDDDEFKTYTLDFSSNASWTGALKQLRVDPSNTSTSGEFVIDYI